MTRPSHRSIGDHWIGVDIGGTKILGVVVAAEASRIVAWKRVPTARAEGRDAVLQRAIDLARELIASHGPVAGAGIGFAGLVDARTQRIDSSVILPGWDNFDLRGAFQSALDLPCAVDNDATVAGIGEYAALGKPPGLNMIVLTVGTGIGGAILIAGSPYRGSTGVAAEFGHMTIDWHGSVAASSNRGSVNGLASGTAMCERATKLARGAEHTSLPRDRAITGRELAEAYAVGDAIATAVVEDGARALGAAVANCLNIFNPDRVALTGGVLNLGGDYLDIVRAEAASRAFDITVHHAQLVPTVHGEFACAHGAACLAQEPCR